MSNINNRTQDLIDFIKSKYNINPEIIKAGGTITLSGSSTINSNNDYYIFEALKDKIELYGTINNNTNSTKFLTFILNPNVSFSGKSINEGQLSECMTSNNKDKEKLSECMTTKDKDKEEIKKYKLIGYISGIITMISIIVIIYLLFIKDKKQE
jgi:hypothetical protein